MIHETENPYVGLMPWSNEAEMSIIGSMFMDNAVIPSVVLRLSGDDFYSPRHKEVYEAMKDLYDCGTPIEPATLIERLKSRGSFDRIGGLEYVTEVMSATVTTANVKYYLEIVCDTAKKRRAFRKINELRDKLATESVADCQEFAADIVKSLDTAQANNTFSAADLVRQFRESKDKPREYIRTGIGKVDNKCHIQKGDYVVIAGRPSSGKTALAIQMLLRMAERGEKVVFFSLETKANKIADRIAANLSNIHLYRIKTNNCGSDWYRVEAEVSKIEGLPFWVVEASGWTVGQIKAKAVELGAGVIFIDYLGLIKGNGKSLYEKATQVSNDLHIMAQQDNIAVFALCQLNREGKNAPDMTTLRDSGGIEQDADIIIIVHNPNDIKEQDADRTERTIIIAKNKEGECGAFPIKFEGEYQRFDDMPF